MPFRLPDADLLSQLHEQHKAVDAMFTCDLLDESFVEPEDISDSKFAGWFAMGLPLMLLKIMLAVRSAVVVCFVAFLLV